MPPTSKPPHDGGQPPKSPLWTRSERNTVRIADDAVAVGLRNGESLCLHGAARVGLVRGHARCLGHSFLQMGDDADHMRPVYSPSIHSLLVIEACGSDAASLPPTDSRLEEFPTVLRIDRLMNQFAGIGRFAPVFANLYGAPENTTWPEVGQATAVASVDEAAGLSAVHIPESWYALADALAAADTPGRTRLPSCVAVGPKAAGKSTLNRFLVNRLLSQSSGGRPVLLLDVDVGQAELSCEGFVSLHAVYEPLLGPAFTHLTTGTAKCLGAHFIGSATPKFDPEHYAAAVADLVGRAMAQAPQNAIALVVNTAGWVRGLGFDLLAHVLGLVQPAFAAVLSPPDGNADDSYESLDQVCRSAAETVVTLQSAAPPVAQHAVGRVNAAEQRQLSLLAYLFQRKSGPDAEWRFSTPLLAAEPRTVPIDAVAVRFLGDQVDPELALAAINGSLVALVAAVPGPATTDAAAALSTAPVPPAESQALGLGLVVAVDRQRNRLWIHTPLRGSALQRVNVLVRSPELALPARLRLDGLLSDSPLLDRVPFVEYQGNDSAHGSGAKRARHNLLRRHLGR